MRSVESRAVHGRGIEKLSYPALGTLYTLADETRRARQPCLRVVARVRARCASAYPRRVSPHHSSAWRESNPFVSHQGASPVSWPRPRAAHVEVRGRNPCAPPASPASPASPADPAEPVGDLRRRRRRHQAALRHCISMACATFNSSFARAAAIVCASRSPPPARWCDARVGGRVDQESAETRVDRVRHVEAEAIGERGIEPVEPSVREEGVHPGAPVQVAGSTHGAPSAAVVASYPPPDRRLSRASSARRARFALRRRPRGRVDVRDGMGAPCVDPRRRRPRRCRRCGGDGCGGHRRAGVCGSNMRGEDARDALVDREEARRSRRVRCLRRRHLRGSLVRRPLGEFHRVGRSPSFLSNLRRVPRRRRRRRQRLGAVSKLAQPTRLARLVIAVEHGVQPKWCDTPGHCWPLRRPP